MASLKSIITNGHATKAAAGLRSSPALGAFEVAFDEAFAGRPYQPTAAIIGNIFKQAARRSGLPERRIRDDVRAALPALFARPSARIDDGVLRQSRETGLIFDPLRRYFADVGRAQIAPSNKSNEAALTETRTNEITANLARHVAVFRRQILEELCEIPAALEIICGWYTYMAENRSIMLEILEYPRGRGDQESNEHLRLICEIAVQGERLRELGAKSHEQRQPAKEDFIALLSSKRPTDARLRDLVAQLGAAAEPGMDDFLVRLRVRCAKADLIKKKMIELNLALPRSIAIAYKCPQGFDVLDLIQEGNIGLMKAVDKFDPEMNVKFSFYAHNWIKDAIKKGILKKRFMVHLMYDDAEIAAKWVKASLEFQQSTGREIDELEIAASLGIDPGRAKEAQRIAREILFPPHGLDDCVGGSALTWADILESPEPGPQEIALSSQRAKKVKEAIDTISDDRARRYLRLCHYFGLSPDSKHTFILVANAEGVRMETVKTKIRKGVRFLNKDPSLRALL
ncbi:MAG TPA: sigma-70 family RNA polymerase sigma factor [Alphaproteobacteria bacterium]|nr:sigma-70 family RNA polymerase sigma factor [Alphaproteobacteria bacterium]